MSAITGADRPGLPHPFGRIDPAAQGRPSTGAMPARTDRRLSVIAGAVYSSPSLPLQAMLSTPNAGLIPALAWADYTISRARMSSARAGVYQARVRAPVRGPLDAIDLISEGDIRSRLRRSCPTRHSNGPLRVGDITFCDIMSYHIDITVSCGRRTRRHNTARSLSYHNSRLVKTPCPWVTANTPRDQCLGHDIWCRPQPQGHYM